MMKTLKYLITAALFIGISTSYSNAQNGQHKERPMPDSAQIEQRINKLKTDLNLNDEQIKRFDSLNAEHRKEVHALRERHAPEREKQRAEMDAERKSFEKDLLEILTPEQQEKFNAIKQQRPEDRKNGKHGPCGNPEESGSNN